MTMMMMLHARLQPAKTLKRIIAAIAGVEKFGRMTILEDCLFLEVMNPNHKVPVSLFLASPWFHSYNYLSSFSTTNPSSTWTIILDLSMFNYFLGLANDDDQVDIQVVSDSDFNRLYFLFDHPEKGIRCHEMIFWRTVSVDMSRLRDMENAYGGGFSVVMPPHHFTHVLRRSMASLSPLHVDITSSMIMLSSGGALRFLEQSVQCGIQNLPEDGFFSLQLSLHVAEYFLSAARIAKSIVIKVPNQAVNNVNVLPPQFRPSICVSIEKFATIHFFFPFNSAVQPLIQNWSSCLELEDSFNFLHQTID